MSMSDDIQMLARPFRSWTDEVTRDVLRAVAVIEQATRGGSRLRFEEIEGIVPPTQITLPDILTRETAQEVARDAWAGGLVTSDALFRNVSLVFVDLMGNPVGALQGNGIWYTRGSFQVQDGSGVTRVALFNTGEISALNASGIARVSAYGLSGLVALRNGAGTDQVVLRSDGTASRFAVIPVVGPADGSADKRLLTVDDLGGVGGGGGLDTEAVDDRVAALIVAGTGITKTYNDAAGTLTLAATGGGAGTRDYPITYVSPTAPTEPRVGDFWVELSGRPASDDPHAELIVSSTAPASPGIGTLWVQA